LEISVRVSWRMKKEESLGRPDTPIRYKCSIISVRSGNEARP
jgi:hypothetical protein